MIGALARLLRRLRDRSGAHTLALSTPEETPERRIDVARERLRETIPPRDDAPADDARAGAP